MNGRELTAEDVVYNLNRWRTSDQGTRYPDLDWESITATDRYTVEVKLQDPPLDALLVLIDDNIGFVNAPEAIEQHGDVADWRNLVGTGPFMLTDWVDGSSMTWVKNPDYWGHDEKYPENRLPYVDELVRLMMPDQATRISAMRTGQIDYLGHNTNGRFTTVDPVESLQRTNPELRVNAMYFSGGGEQCLQRDQASLRRHPRAARHTDGGRPRYDQQHLLQGLDAAGTHGGVTAVHRKCDSVCGVARGGQAVLPVRPGSCREAPRRGRVSARRRWHPIHDDRQLQISPQTSRIVRSSKATLPRSGSRSRSGNRTGLRLPPRSRVARATMTASATGVRALRIAL